MKKGILVNVLIRLISFCLFSFSGRKSYGKIINNAGPEAITQVPEVIMRVLEVKMQVQKQ